MNLHLLQLPDFEFNDEPLRCVLDRAESDQCIRLARAQDRRRSITARALLRCVVSDHVGLLPRDVTVERCVHGRIQPIPLDCASRVYVSLAAAGRFVAAAASREMPVGVDVEPISEERFPLGLAEEILSPREMRVFVGLPADKRTAWLSRAWVMKEAVLKTLGLGLFSSPSELDTGLDATDLSDGRRLNWRRLPELANTQVCDFRWHGASVGVATGGRPELRCNEATIEAVVAACRGRSIPVS